MNTKEEPSDCIGDVLVVSTFISNNNDVLPLACW